MRIYESDLGKLLNGRQVMWLLQSLLFMNPDLQKFLNGQASYLLVIKIGIYESDLQILLNKAGKKGAVGL